METTSRRHRRPPIAPGIFGAVPRRRWRRQWRRRQLHRGNSSVFSLQARIRPAERSGPNMRRRKWENWRKLASPLLPRSSPPLVSVIFFSYLNGMYIARPCARTRRTFPEMLYERCWQERAAAIAVLKCIKSSRATLPSSLYHRRAMRLLCSWREITSQEWVLASWRRKL